MPVDPETLRDLLSANDRHADIIHSESSDGSITRARVYKSRKIVRTGTVMVRFVDQMSVSNSENEDILSFGRKLIALGFIERRDFVRRVCHFDKCAASVTPRQIFVTVHEVHCGSLRQFWIKVPQIIESIPSRFCRAAEYPVVFDCGVDPIARHIKKRAEGQDDNCCGDGCVNSA